MVLNSLLPNELDERSIKILYADGMKEKYIRFYLQDQVFPEKDHLLKKLEDVEFRDTFRDEPFRYHQRLLDILLQSTLVSADKREFDPQLTDD